METPIYHQITVPIEYKDYEVLCTFCYHHTWSAPYRETYYHQVDGLSRGTVINWQTISVLNTYVFETDDEKSDFEFWLNQYSYDILRPHLVQS